ncbi:MAG TPA: tetratricopeptide repeat protein [Cytophagales bacterium]|jgi:hypothetical protein|nr:tetratricopeptide repeat protein [Cytophagales bacterium]
MINCTNKIRLYTSIFVLITLNGCNSIINKIYDDTTAKYNAYFVANEIINDIELNLENNTVINYDSLIPINYAIDSSIVSQHSEKTKKSIEKLSILIQRHPESKYVYPSYVLIGKSRLLDLNLKQSIITFKYVNSKSNIKKAKDLALINLMRSYTKNKQLNEAEEVYNYLKNKTIYNDYQIDFYKYSVYLFKQLKKNNELLINLKKIENLTKDRTLKNKVYFLIGQIHLNNNNYDEAQKYFERCIKNNPKLEIELFAKLYYVRSSTKSSDEETINKYFKKLIRDKKNYDYLNRIYFELGQYYYEKDFLNKALDNYKTSIQKTINNKNLLFKAHLEIANINYYKYNNYSISKLYYDSALQNINRENVLYKQLKDKSDVLNKLVNNLLTINKNDSLISLTTLSINELENILNDYINKLKKEKKKKKVELKENLNFYNEDSKIIKTNNNPVWYFNNMSIVNRGKDEFYSKWGDRKLTDNWRVQSKIIFISNNEKEIEIEKKSIITSEEKNSETINKESLILLLPFKIEDKQILLNEIEKSLYELGKIYIQNLNEINKGIKTYTQLINRFSESEFLPDVLYQLYLLSEEKNYYKNYIIEKFPESIFAKLIINPNYEIDEFEEYNLLLDLYKILYEKLLSEKNDYVIKQIDSLEILYKKNEYFENLSLLKSIAKGKKYGNFTLQYELKKFLKNSLLTNTSEYANSLLNSAKNVQKKFIFSGLPKIIKENDYKFYYIIINNHKSDLIFTIINKITKELNLQNIVYIDEFILKENFSFYAISETNWKDLKKIEKKFNDYILNKESKVNANFVIGETNINILFEAKNFNHFIKIYKK